MASELFAFLLGAGTLAFCQFVAYWLMSRPRRKILSSRDYYNICADCSIGGNS